MKVLEMGHLLAKFLGGITEAPLGRSRGGT